MVTRIQRVVVDDFDASTEGVGTYRFALEGIEYEIDLSQENRQRLRRALAPFITAGRRLPQRRNSRVPAKKTQARAVRRWWAQHERIHLLPGWRANGPIPRQVHAAYQRAHPSELR